MASSLENVYDYITIPDFNAVSTDKQAYAEAFIAQYREQDPIRGRRLVQGQGKAYLVANPPARPLSASELDAVYELPYTREPHPFYQRAYSSAGRGKVFDHIMQGMFWSLFVLCAYNASGTHDTGAQPRIDYCRGRADDKGRGGSRGIYTMWEGLRQIFAYRPVKSS